MEHNREYYFAKLQTLNLSDDFLFRMVMRNPEICTLVIEEVLNIKIRKIEYIEEQKDIKNVYRGKGVRLDVYADNDDGSVFNLEMQTDNKGGLEKRARYYQSGLDVHLLKEGEDYRNLKDNYVIFICCFDNFKLERYKYTFESFCTEDKELALKDGAYKIFLNTRGSRGEVSDDLKAFLKYIENTTNDFAEGCGSTLVKMINENVKKIKKNHEMGVNYMFEEIYKNELRNDALAEGRARGIEEGMEKGMEKGIDSVIVEMIKSGLEASFINRITNLPIDRIERLREAYT
ncbi:MAG: Rpn family recombination-promoting nuclease/putative transposase [Clostridiales bacterium]|nr:Rpn family recombination-promoting nuclease/putative transposase [Clostridiales bacterium]